MVEETDRWPHVPGTLSTLFLPSNDKEAHSQSIQLSDHCTRHVQVENGTFRRYDVLKQLRYCACNTRTALPQATIRRST